MVLEHLESLPIVWTPKPEAFSASPLGRMAARHGLADIDAVTRRATADPAWYWRVGSEDVGIRWSTLYDEVVDSSAGIAHTRFFRGGQLNWADYTVDRWVDEGRGDADAIRWEGEDGSRRTVSYSALKDEIDRTAGALRALGVGIGDTVGLVIPMVPESVSAILAVVKIGAVIVPMFSGYAAPAIRERMEQSGARYLITADGSFRRGKTIPLKETVDAAIADLNVEAVIVLRRTGVETPMKAGRDVWWHDVVPSADPVRDAVPMRAEDPCYLMFTSGSTGRPKGAVHTHGGWPLKVAMETRHGLGIDETQTLLWVTDMGWIMGGVVITAALSNGGTAALFEGTPDWPRPDRLWEVTANLGVTVLGISPTAIRALSRHGDEHPARHDLSRLCALASTGEPWNLEPWMWCFEVVGGGRLPIVNISGGTEVGGSLLVGSTLLPQKPMAFNGPPLGVLSDIVDDDGVSVRSEVGELVVRGPWPGMSSSLWNDDARYTEAYWTRFPGLWHQGDFGYVDADGYWYLLGRSDDTMNIAGKRVGPAEIESAAGVHPAVVESAAVSVPDDLKGEALVVFAVLTPGADHEEASAEIVRLIRAHLGPTVTPKAIHIVPELPKTRNGKILRRVARAVYLGADLGDLTALENPSALDTLPTSAIDHGPQPPNP
ncbi:MAG TPA: AMP-binding protein [Pseudolysinimonas sp.]|nr:AMP-binding protein [Pseudolysinimonas sp.]